MNRNEFGNRDRVVRIRGENLENIKEVMWKWKGEWMYDREEILVSCDYADDFLDEYVEHLIDNKVKKGEFGKYSFSGIDNLNEEYLHEDDRDSWVDFNVSSSQLDDVYDYLMSEDKED